MVFTVNVEVSIPQLRGLTKLGAQLVANLSAISEALDQLQQTLDQELTEIAMALQNSGPTQDEVTAVAQRVLDLKDRISTIIP